MRSSVTARQILFDALSLLGRRDMDLSEEEACRYINYSQYTLSNLLDGLYSMWEVKGQSVSLTSGIVCTTSGISYTSATKTINDLPAVPKGTLLFLYNSFDGYVYQGIALSDMASDTELVSDTGGGDITVDYLYVLGVLPPWYRRGVDVSDYNIKKLKALKDSTFGDVVRLSGPEFLTAQDNPNLSTAVYVWDFADSLHLGGTSATLTLYYCSDPTEVTSLSSLVDLETEHHDALVKDVARQLELAHPSGEKKVVDDPYGFLRNLYQTIGDAFKNKTLEVK